MTGQTRGGSTTTMASHVRAGTPHVTMRVPFAASSVSVVRRDLHSWLEAHGAAGDRVDDARVVISELVANSVRHARPLDDGCLVVSWSLGDRGLVLSVSDGGSTTSPHTVLAPLHATSGRGMSIVESLVTEWWLDGDGRSSTVHTRLDLT